VTTARGWLFKTEPDEFSIDDLARQSPATWDGVRNYKARNYLRDEVKLGDEVLIYHSSCKSIGIVGLATIVRCGYSDPAQFEPSSPYFDAKSTRESPRWYCVDLQFKRKFRRLLSLAELKAQPKLKAMPLFTQPRLSVQPVAADEFSHVMAMA
jgi:predicted RNA-binding protein with PUA-like domain